MSNLPINPNYTVYPLDTIAARLGDRQYDSITNLLSQLDNTDHRIRDYNINVHFNNIRDIKSIRWGDLINIVSNLPRPIVIHWGRCHGQLLFEYCLLMRIPFTIVLRTMICINRIDLSSIIELTADDIEYLDDDCKEHLLQISNRYNIHYYRRLINNMEPSTPWYIRFFYRLFNLLRMIDRGSILDEVRSHYHKEEYYTQSILDDEWRKLTPQQIVEQQFDPQHLIRIGVEVPDVNIVLMEVGRIGVRKLKLLLPYSDPSEENILKILEKLEDDESCIYNKAIIDIVILVRYKRWLMSKYRYHPFVNHLIQESDIKMKNSRTNKNNC